MYATINEPKKLSPLKHSPNGAKQKRDTIHLRASTVRIYSPSKRPKIGKHPVARNMEMYEALKRSITAPTGFEHLACEIILFAPKESLNLNRLIVRVTGVNGQTSAEILLNMREYVLFSRDMKTKYGAAGEQFFQPESVQWWCDHVERLLSMKIGRRGKLLITVSKASIENFISEMTSVKVRSSAGRVQKNNFTTKIKKAVGDAPTALHSQVAKIGKNYADSVIQDSPNDDKRMNVQLTIPNDPKLLISGSQIDSAIDSVGRARSGSQDYEAHDEESSEKYSLNEENFESESAYSGREGMPTVRDSYILAKQFGPGDVLPVVKHASTKNDCDKEPLVPMSQDLSNNLNIFPEGIRSSYECYTTPIEENAQSLDHKDIVQSNAINSRTKSCEIKNSPLSIHSSEYTDQKQDEVLYETAERESRENATEDNAVDNIMDSENRSENSYDQEFEADNGEKSVDTSINYDEWGDVTAQKFETERKSHGKSGIQLGRGNAQDIVTNKRQQKEGVHLHDNESSYYDDFDDEIYENHFDDEDIRGNSEISVVQEVLCEMLESINLNASLE